MLSAWGCLGAGGGAPLRISEPVAGSLLLGLWTVECWWENQEGSGGQTHSRFCTSPGVITLRTLNLADLRGFT